MYVLYRVILPDIVSRGVYVCNDPFLSGICVFEKIRSILLFFLRVIITTRPDQITLKLLKK